MAEDPRRSPAAVPDAATVSRLADGYVLPVDPDGRRALADPELAAALSVPVSAGLPLADWAMVRLAPADTLTPRQYGILDLADRVTAAFLEAPAFHPQLATVLATGRGILAAAALPDDGWLCNPQHPARRLCACLHRLALGWQPDLGPGADAQRVQAAGWLTLAGTAGWATAADTAERWLEDERRRVERITQRLADGEAGALRARRARQLAARTLNQALGDRLIGAGAAAVLREDWFAAMQWVLLKDGEQGALWQRVKRLTGTLRWTLSPELGEDGRNKLYRVVAQANEELEALAPLVLHDAAARDRLLATLDAEHLLILRDSPRETLPFTPVDAQDSLAAGGAALSGDLLQRVAGLAQGQWILLRDGAQSRRIRLLLRQDDAHQLLFVNALGVKALATSWEAFAPRLANGDALCLPATDLLAACIATVVEAADAEQRRARLDRMEALRIAREQAAAEARALEIARQKALAEAQALEAVRLETQRKAAAIAAEAEAATRDARQQRMQRARLLASSLTIGAWLAFRGDDGTSQNRRLTVVLPSSGKYIFVDADGTGKLEVMRDELVRCLADGSIAPLNKDQRLDDALTRVVDNIRNERDPQGGPA